MGRASLDWNYVFDGAIWRAPHHRDFYLFSVGYNEEVKDTIVTIYHVEGRKTPARPIIAGFSNHVAPRFKQLARNFGLRPKKRKGSERHGHYLSLWW